ncbi:MAG: ATP-binding protein [Ilumatobacteraceae bacterium]
MGRHPHRRGRAAAPAAAAPPTRDPLVGRGLDDPPRRERARRADEPRRRAGARPQLAGAVDLHRGGPLPAGRQPAHRPGDERVAGAGAAHRMRPIRTVWAKLPRLVREVSMACGRQVHLELDGEETELDKSVVEAIKDPLTHCVRNAVDHGIESPEERLAAGKRAEGVLSLKASHENGQVIIQIRDDGRGIDVHKIRQKALDKGIHPEDVLARMSERGAGPDLRPRLRPRRR